MVNSSFAFWNFLEFYLSEYFWSAVVWIYKCGTSRYGGPIVFTCFNYIFLLSWFIYLFYLLFLFFFVANFFSFFFLISWRLITSQHFSVFCHTLTWISHGVMMLSYFFQFQFLAMMILKSIGFPLCRSWTLSKINLFLKKCILYI